MVNCDENGVRYGIISAHSLHPDVVFNLCYGSQARDVSYEAAEEEAKAQAEREADNIEEEVRIAAAERDYALLTSDSLMEKEVEAAYERLGFDGREDYVEATVSRLIDDFQCEEPVYAGTLDDVKYRTTWLGGACLVWVFYSPHKGHFRGCSPCVPHAADLDNPDEYGVEGYDVPTDWRYSNESN